MDGFGWNFYGYFVFSGAWIAVYFLWATWMARRDRASDLSSGSSGPGRAGPRSTVHSDS